MSKKVPVIDPKALPMRMPLFFTALVWLLLDRFDPAGWVHGAAWTFVGLVWFAYIYRKCVEVRVNLFDEKENEDPPSRPSKWRERLRQLQEQQRRK